MVIYRYWKDISASIIFFLIRTYIRTCTDILQEALRGRVHIPQYIGCNSRVCVRGYIKVRVRACQMHIGKFIYILYDNYVTCIN